MQYGGANSSGHAPTELQQDIRSRLESVPWLPERLVEPWRSRGQIGLTSHRTARYPIDVQGIGLVIGLSYVASSCDPDTRA